MVTYLPVTNSSLKPKSTQFSHIKRTFAMIKPDSYLNIGKILYMIEKEGFSITNIRMTKMGTREAQCKLIHS